MNHRWVPVSLDLDEPRPEVPLYRCRGCGKQGTFDFVRTGECPAPSLWEETES
jgi:hypothetical protein